MRSSSLARSRRRLTKYLIPAVLVLYIAMIFLNSVLETEHVEVFPFFKWKLFANVPEWEAIEYGLAVEAIDGEPVSRDLYLIPSDDVRDWKALRLAITACTKGGDCDGTVEEVLVPIVREALGPASIDFRIVEARVNLGDVRDRIDDVADGMATRTDFLRPIEVIGRWNTETGPLSAVATAN